MAIEVERLVATLEARFNQYEKSLNKALGQTNRSFSQIERRGTILESRLAKLGVNSFAGFVKGGLAAAAAAVSLTAAVNGTKDALQQFGDIADNAKASGLDAEFFQGLAYQAELAGVSMKQLSGALGAFNRNAGLAIEGKGRMVTQLRALNPALLESVRAATLQEERIRLVADALAGEESGAKRAAIATAAFGDAGLKMVDAFQGGAASIDRTVARARELGIVVDRELIARADELGDEFDTASKVMDLQFKQALVDLAPLMISAAQLAGNIAGGIKDIVTWVQTLGQFLDGPGAGGSMFGDLSAAGKNDLRQALSVASINAEAVRNGRRAPDNLYGGMLGGNGQIKLLPPPAAPSIPTLDEIDARNKAAEAAIRQAERVKELIANLEHERSLIGLSARDQAIMNALRDAGAAATDEQRARIEELTAAIYDETAAAEQMQQIMEDLVGIAADAGKALIEAFADGKIEANELIDILGDVAKKLIDIGGNLLFGALTGGASGISFRAGGGPVSGGRPYVVGERGPELMVPGRSGTVVPSDMLQRAVSSGGGGATFAPVINIDARGAQMGAADAIGAEVRRQLVGFTRFELPRLHRQMIADPARANL